MTKLTIDASLEAKLTAPAELTNNSGRTVGYFLPPEEHARLQQLAAETRARAYALASAQYSEQELDDFDREGGELTYDEVKQSLVSP